MKPSEILRSLADMIDARQTEKSLGATGAVNPKVMPKDTYASPNDSELASAPEVFLPPLQMKLELLKKATRVDNVYDEESDDEEDFHSYDDLTAIKRNAGINVAVIDALGDDEPLDN